MPSAIGRSKPPASFLRSAGGDGQFASLLLAFLARRYPVEVVEEIRPQPSDTITPALRDRVAALHAEGKRPCEIGRICGLNRKQVARIFAGPGVTNPPSVPASTRKAEILDLRKQGLTQAEIGERLGYSRKAIAKALRSSD
jgi:DNA-binding CsgD family transcriptional regulator